MKRIVVFLCVAFILVGFYFFFRGSKSSLNFIEILRPNTSNIRLDSKSTSLSIGIHTEENPQVIGGNNYTLYTVSNARLVSLKEGAIGTTPTQLDFEYNLDKSVSRLHIESSLPVSYIVAGPTSAAPSPLGEAKIGKLYNIRFVLPVNEVAAQAMSSAFCVTRKAIAEISKESCVKILDTIGAQNLSESQLSTMLRNGNAILKADQVLVSSILLQPYQ